MSALIRYAVNRASLFRTCTSRGKLLAIRRPFATQNEPKVSNIHNDSKDFSKKANSDKEEWELIYRFKYIYAMKALCRMKIYQTVFLTLVTPITINMYSQSLVSLGSCQFFIGLNIFSCATLYLFGSLFRKVIGIVYINDKQTKAKIAHLGFWGNRIDTVHDIMDIAPVPDHNFMNEMFCKVKHAETLKLLYYLNLKQASIEDPDKFFNVFGTYGLK